MPTPLAIFCGTAPVHTFMFFLTKNSNSKNKILCGRPQNLVWSQNREKIILNQRSQLWKSISQRTEKVMSTDFAGGMIFVQIFEKIKNIMWIFNILVLFVPGIGFRRFGSRTVRYVSNWRDTESILKFPLILLCLDIFVWSFLHVIQPFNMMFQL